MAKAPATIVKDEGSIFVDAKMEKHTVRVEFVSSCSEDAKSSLEAFLTETEMSYVGSSMTYENVEFDERVWTLKAYFTE